MTTELSPDELRQIATFLDHLRMAGDDTGLHLVGDALWDSETGDIIGYIRMTDGEYVYQRQGE